MTILWTEDIKISFNIEDDIIGGKVNSRLLRTEINNQLTKAKEIDYVNSNVTDKEYVDIYFQSALDSTDKTNVETTIANHVAKTLSRLSMKDQSIAEQNNSTTEWDDVFLYNTPDLISGIWSILLSFELKQESYSSSSVAQARILAQKSGTVENVISNAASIINAYDVRTLGSSVNIVDGDSWEIKIQIRRQGAVNMAKIQNIRFDMKLDRERYYE